MIWNDRIRQLRELNKMTLKEISARLGVTEATAQRYEAKNGIKNIPYEIVEKYAQIFGVSPAYIMGWESSETIDYMLTLSDSQKILIETVKKMDEKQAKLSLDVLSHLIAFSNEIKKE